MKISNKLPMKCGCGLMNLSSYYPDLFVYIISEKFLEPIYFFTVILLYIKNGRKNKKN